MELVKSHDILKIKKKEQIEQRTAGINLILDAVDTGSILVLSCI